MQVKPNIMSPESKRIQVEKMFDSISPKYDLLNRTLSMGIDTIWRKRTIKAIKAVNPKRILDVATGTGDLAIEALKLNPDEVIGVDISEGMLSFGYEKIKKHGLKNISLEKGDSEKLRFEDGYFDAVTVAFGVRNFDDLSKGLKEMNRVLRAKGMIAILEFSNPSVFPVKQLYRFYFNKILPKMGNLVSGSNSAYTYLPQSVKAFPDGTDFLNIMTECGYSEVKQNRYMFGICTLYTGIK